MEKTRKVLKRIVIFLVTNNIHKFNESRKLLGEDGISIGMLRFKPAEIQSNNLEQIARNSALDSFKKFRIPIIVEDAGLFIDQLKGFPGSVIAFYSSEFNESVSFQGETKGIITKKEKKGRRTFFGFDPIFQPNNAKKTFAEMTHYEKNKYSHRAKALRKFVEWYRTKYTDQRHFTIFDPRINHTGILAQSKKNGNRPLQDFTEKYDKKENF